MISRSEDQYDFDYENYEFDPHATFKQWMLNGSLTNVYKNRLKQEIKATYKSEKRR